MMNSNCYPWPLRLTTWIVIASQLLTPYSAHLSAALEEPASSDPAPLVAPATVTVNRTVPVVQPPPLEPSFSANPSDQEIFRCGVFAEPLIPMGAPTSIDENRQLSEMILAFAKRTGQDDVSVLVNYLDNHPDSPWRVSLLLNLGLIYRKTGYFSRALSVWEQAWNLGKNQTDAKARAVVDRSVGEFAELNARLGRFDRLDALFLELEGRDIRGPATELITGAKEGVWAMKNRPGIAFRCGPFAVGQIHARLNPFAPFQALIYDAQSTQNGTSLEQVRALAFEAGLDYQMARRQPGAPVLLPSVIHWNVGHFAALIEQKDGLFLVKDPTFGMDIWITQTALEAEASGYFLVPADPLPAGWEAVPREIGETVWGKGQTSGPDPDGTGQCDPKAGGYASGGGGATECKGMAQYSFHALLASLNIADVPVGYSPPRGPAINFLVTYNLREARQPATFSYSNLGNKWTFDWLSYVTDEPLNTNANVLYFGRGGGTETFTNLGNGTFSTQIESRTQLFITSTNSYERISTDGSKQIFGLATAATSARKIFMTQEIDPQGNTVAYTYDSNFRLVSVTDALGQVTTLAYELSGDNLKITKVTDPFGRYATFEYNGSGQLTNITDVIGLDSAFTYGTGDLITSLTTPYGTTAFSAGANGKDRWVEAVDPLGQKERAEYKDLSGLPNTEPVAPTGMSVGNNFLKYRNSFYWDKRAMQESPNDVTKAKVYHWMHQTGDSVAAGVLESEKMPLEARVWYNYPGQSSPHYTGSSVYRSVAGRVLDDGTTQLHKFEHNDLGKMTQYTDPLGRITTYTYATNLIDLLEVRQTAGSTNELLGTYTYTTNHLPLTVTDAAGQSTSFAYTTNWQVASVTNALNEAMTFAYDTNGYLTTIAGALTNATTSFAYDSYGRVRTVTDSEGYTLTYDYDALDRPSKVTYLDGTFEQLVYSRLDPVLAKDRAGRWTSTVYNPLRQVVAIEDALGRITQFDWCSCGSLNSLTDALGRTTTWFRDLQGRATQKLYADGTVTSHLYETNSSRIKEVTDAKGQKTKYEYFKDDTLKQIAYTNAASATPTVSFTYDTNYNRLLTMIDGTGTTAYGYHAITNPPALGAGQLATIDGPLGNDTVSYTYDELGRVKTRAINGVGLSLAYDSLGRVTTSTNALGAFTNAYVNATPRLSSISYPNGQTTTFSYLNNTNDQRLQTIWHKTSGGVTVSQFDYTYDVEGQIQTWTQQADSATAIVHEFEYDPVNQLLAATAKNSATQALVQRHVYGYDKAGNLTSEQIGSSVSLASHNNVNQLTARTGTGPMRFQGSLNELGTVKVAGLAAAFDSRTTNFVGYADLSAGTNTVPVIATDYSANSRTNNYQIVVTNGPVAKTLAYDLNGNLVTMTTATSTNTYEWDAADRLLAVNIGTNRSEFTYDGLSRRVRIVEKTNGEVTSDKRFLWCSPEICEERDASGNNVTKRFFGQGVQQSGTNYFYTRDHLGSVRELMDSTSSVRARYEYDPYGRRTKVSGDLEADFGFTGHYFHVPSGLHLALYRAYDADTGRWLSKDPVNEAAGINLYRYVDNNPANAFDPLGLWSWSCFGIGALKGLIGVGIGVGIGLAVAATAPAAVAVAIAVVAAGAGGYGTGKTLYEAASGEEWTTSGDGRQLSDDARSARWGAAAVDLATLGVLMTPWGQAGKKGDWQWITKNAGDRMRYDNDLKMTSKETFLKFQDIPAGQRGLTRRDQGVSLEAIKMGLGPGSRFGLNAGVAGAANVSRAGTGSPCN